MSKKFEPAPSGVKSAAEMGLHTQPPPKLPEAKPAPKTEEPHPEQLPATPEQQAYPSTGMSWGQAQQAMKDGHNVARAARIHGPLHQGDIDAKDWMILPPDAPY